MTKLGDNKMKTWIEFEAIKDDERFIASGPSFESLVKGVQQAEPDKTWIVYRTWQSL